jgi:hypothetical protein
MLATAVARQDCHTCERTGGTAHCDVGVTRLPECRQG